MVQSHLSVIRINFQDCRKWERDMKVLVAGATGYVGKQLVAQLVQAGHVVTCMVRDALHASFPGARVVEANALDPATLSHALQDIEVAYYLIHSMSGGADGFEQRDREAASNFATAAKDVGVHRLIYLGGLASPTSPVSSHLKSRQETGEQLRKFGPPVAEFRAGIIVGNGSISFEMIRHLTERLPVMICPRWVSTRTQPIAVTDVLQYLVGALMVPESAGKIVEIGGASVETYRSMMLTYAHMRGLRRWLIRVPVLTPRLSSYWLKLVTPLPASVARPLIEGLRTEVVCTSTAAEDLFPDIHPVSYSEAVTIAQQRPLPDVSFTQGIADDQSHTSVIREGLICDISQALVHARPEQIFSILQSLGGESGWLYLNWLWQLRGLLDRGLGGIGMTRHETRKGPFKAGNYVDFWRIENVAVPQTLLLRAEMKLPGRAWLQFVLTPKADGHTLLRCCAWFEPRGLAGEIYWWALYPIHQLIFLGMVRAIKKQAEAYAHLQEIKV
jgi:uncharacterized protein YbjT (DUF2867 family)